MLFIHRSSLNYVVYMATVLFNPVEWRHSMQFNDYRYVLLVCNLCGPFAPSLSPLPWRPATTQWVIAAAEWTDRRPSSSRFRSKQASFQPAVGQPSPPTSLPTYLRTLASYCTAANHCLSEAELQNEILWHCGVEKWEQRVKELRVWRHSTGNVDQYGTDMPNSVCVCVRVWQLLAVCLSDCVGQWTDTCCYRRQCSSWWVRSHRNTLSRTRDKRANWSNCCML